MDEGQTLVGRAKRINPRYEGQGFFKQFGASMAEWRRQNNIRRTAFTATDANSAITRSTFKSQNRLILTRVSRALNRLNRLHHIRLKFAKHRISASLSSV